MDYAQGQPSPADLRTLRDLARRIADIAASPEQAETKRLWIAHNGLRPERPMVVIDQVCWNEFAAEPELRLTTEHETCRQIEWNLRETLYRWNHFPVDMVVEPFLRVPKAKHTTGYGLRVEEDVAVLDPTGGAHGHNYHRQLHDMGDVERIAFPTVRHDRAETARRVAWFEGVLDDALPVRASGEPPWFAMWDRLIELMGVEETLFDLADRPEFIHALCERWCQAACHELDQLESEDLLDATLPTIHCSYTYTDELPGDGYDPEHARACDCWGAGFAQILVSVGPRMHDEFDLQYAKRYLDRCGLVYYGCCEPLHHKIDIIRAALPNVRKISISPWADVRVAGERMGRDVIAARKPNPVYLARAGAIGEARAEMEDTLDAFARTGTPVEFILKDISTLRYEPKRLWDWADMAMAVVKG